MIHFKKTPILIPILVSLLPLIPLFLTNDLNHTHDGMVHLVRMGAYYKALLDGQILPRWAGDLNFGYGMPLFNFMYHTPYLIAPLFIAIHIPLVTTFKLVLACSYILSAIFMYKAIQSITNSNKTSCILTIIYQFAPFRLVEMTIRGSFGEIYTYAFFPLVIYAIVRMSKIMTLRSMLVVSFSTFLLIISHNSISLSMFATILLFIIFCIPSKKSKVYSLFFSVIGVLSASFYWIPALLEHKYTYGDLFMKNMYISHFPPLINFFIPNFFNDPRLQTGGISVQIGLIHTLIILYMIYAIYKKQSKYNNILIFSLIVTVLSLVLMQPISTLLWKNISLLRQFQFPWRLLSLINISSTFAMLSLINTKLWKNTKIIVFMLIFIVGSTIWYWNPPLGFDKVKDESIYWNYPLNTTYFGETDIIWSAGPAKKYPAERIEVIEGAASITHFKKSSIKQTFTVNATTPSTIVSNTQYFPGWRVYVDNQKTPIEFQNELWRGLITFKVPEGQHSVKVIFEKSKIQIFSEIITIIIVLLTAILYICNPTKKYEKK